MTVSGFIIPSKYLSLFEILSALTSEGHSVAKTTWTAAVEPGSPGLGAAALWGSVCP
jgi:hypothetical protein